MKCRVKSLFKTLFVPLFVILTFASCSQISSPVAMTDADNSFDVYSDSGDRTNTGIVRFVISEYEENNARVLMPSAMDVSTITEIKVSAENLDDSTDTFTDKTFSSYEEFKNAKLRLHVNRWGITITVKNSLGTIATGAISELNVAAVNTVYNATVSLNPSSTGSGTYNITVKYPTPSDGSTISVEGYLVPVSASTVSGTIATGTAGSVLLVGEEGPYTVVNVSGTGTSGMYMLRLLFGKIDESSVTLCSQNYAALRLVSGRNTTGTLVYNEINTPYTISYCKADGTALTPPDGAPTSFNTTQTITLPDYEPGAHMEFKGWYLNDEFTGAAVTGWSKGQKTNNVTLYAKIDAEEYSVVYLDYSELSVFTGKTATLPIKHTYGSLTIIPVPAHIYSGDDNEIVFNGWYTNMTCTSELSKTVEGDYYIPASYTGSSITGDIRLYAKWSYKNIYVDPQNATGAAENGGGRGYSSEVPYLNLANAITVLDNGTSFTNKNIILLSSILTSNTSAFTQLNTLTVSKNITVKRAATYTTGPLITADNDSADNKLLGVTIDGGAVWSSDGAIGYAYSNAANTGVKASAPLVQINSGCSLEIVANVFLQNNCSSGKGGAVYCEGTLNMSAGKIQNNHAFKGGGIYLENTAKTAADSTVNLSGSALIGGTVETESGTVCLGNSAQNGAGIFVSHGTVNMTGSASVSDNRACGSSGGTGGGICLASTEESPVTWDSAAPSRVLVVNGSSAEIKNNIAANKTSSSLIGNMGTGGGIHVDRGLVQILDGAVTGNTAGAGGGGINVSTYGQVQLNSARINTNYIYSSGNGAGIALTSGNLSMNMSSTISSNGAKTTGCTINGNGIYISSGVLTMYGGSKVSDTNDVYITKTGKAIKLADDVATDAAQITLEEYEIDKTILEMTAGSTSLLENNNEKFTLANKPAGTGWKIDPDGKLRNYTGGSFTIITYSFAFSLADSAGSAISEFNTGTETTIKVVPAITKDTDGVTSTVDYDTIKDDVTWYIQLMYDGSLTGLESTTDTITIPASFPTGNYTVYAAATYSGESYDATMALEGK